LLKRYSQEEGKNKPVKIGFIGLGTMGSRMAARLLDAGYPLLVYNRTAAKLKPLIAEGALAASSIAEVSKKTDVLFTSLSMPADVEEVYLGENGVLSSGHEGLACVDCTTVGVDASRKVYAEAVKRKIFYLDAPVSGGPEGAEKGTLTVMVGGNREIFARVEPILRVIGENVQYLGESGSGSAAKLINQYLVAVNLLAAAEAMVAAGKIGLNQKQLYELLQVSYGQSKMLERLMEQFVLPGNFEPGGAMKYLLKDLHLSNELLSQSGIEPISGKVAQDAYEKAFSAGWGDKDMASIYCWLTERFAG
jgi:3-hydroxyisobutyrate dehydrogenase